MNLLIQEMTKEDLQHLINESVRKVFSEQFQSEQTKPSESTYLTRAEVSKLLQISLVTLSKLVSTGRLQSYRIGKRILFKKDEVEKALTPIVTSKFQRK